MDFLIQFTGSHLEGHEGGARFDALVKDFRDRLRTNGFITSCVVATHNFSVEPEPKLLDPEPEVAETTTEGEQAATLTVNFASEKAIELADAYNLTDTDFAGVDPTGSGGFTADDVRRVIKDKA